MRNLLIHWMPCCVLGLLITACASSNPKAESTSETQRWQCRNDIEIACLDGSCSVEQEAAFTPMDIHVDTEGSLSICAYTGCWQGGGKAIVEGAFLVLVGQGLEHSTGSDSEDIVLTIDRSDGVGTVKAGSFATPLLCTRNASPKPDADR